ncbi:hypothetical protein WL32_17245 [Burkholderia cepacia]|uniref:hypothetical protein n=1 Tax=Burkholderia cepacia TaxID=292 RepID=UPI00076CEF02|nr:hypothetical protein [Burkholderia cepacia]KWB20871.1 hypothetical protein WL32_17245 [Burkholderia cepacia]
MKQMLFLALVLLAGAVGLGLTGLTISQNDPMLHHSCLPAGLFYTGACIALAGALVCLLVSVNKGE